MKTRKKQFEENKNMAACLRKAVCKKISQLAGQNNVYHSLEVPSKIHSSGPVLHWVPANNFTEAELVKLLPHLEHDDTNIIQNVRVVPAVGRNPLKIEFQLQPQVFVETLLLEDKEPTARPKLQEHMVFEYSSPNIAKPFHVGHLRSTIIGNVLANLHHYLGYRVSRLNYLGDWGTQFGMLQVGVEMKNVTDVQMKERPIETLYEAYVAANTAAKIDPSIADKARQYFSNLETGADAEMTRQWEKYRRYTIAELEKVYARLGVSFDSYEWESQYSQSEIGEVLQSLQAKSLLLKEHDGRKVVQVDGRRVPIIKSDGSTLYLARDIAAILARFQRYQFDRIYYIVDNAQTDHFNALFKTTASLCGDELPLTRMQHVKFGRILGMSTRSGNVVFLSDVLNEARDIMLEKQQASPTTKIDLSTESVADVLGVSAVIVNDLKQRRQRNYEFDWQRAIQVNGDTAIKLHYTHCRLHSLLKNVAHIDVSGAKPLAVHLMEPVALELLNELARFDQAVWLAKEKLEACVLVAYLFALCNATSRALKHLNVKNEANTEIQKNRILLFRAAKSTLNAGMKILSLKPLERM